MNVNPEEIAILVGHQRLEIFVLQRQIVALQQRIAELEKKNADAGNTPTGS